MIETSVLRCPACDVDIAETWAQIDHMVTEHPERVRALLPEAETWRDDDCPVCGQRMKPEHAHYRCGACGYRDSCCQ